ncbi:MAG: protein kinase [Clostridiales bacterium]|nr:protein kinase [Clostridiales bacterium]
MARIRTNKNICLYCFGDLDTDRVCMNCHHKADDTPSPPHHLPQRSVIGPQNRYLIGKALGEGGFGITYLGWDLQQGIKVAVKEYFPSGYVTRVAGNNQVIINSKQNQAASNRGLKRFVEEARALAKIKNLGGVVNVRDFFSANGTAYIVMEFLDGISLKKYLQRRGGKVGTDEILTIMRPVMDSLVQVHKIGLIHRDISPDNIIITKSNEVKLIDFGAAKYSNPDGKSLSVVLKQGFAPPEQYDTHGEQGPWTDVYALGVTLYFAVTGVLPPESIRIMMGKEAIKRPSEMGFAIDAGVENALMKSLAVDKKKRYQDVQQMINGLYNPRAPRKTVSDATAAPPTAPKKSVIPRTAMGVTPDTTEPTKPAARAVRPTSSPITATERSITKTETVTTPDLRTARPARTATVHIPPTKPEISAAKAGTPTAKPTAKPQVTPAKPATAKSEIKPVTKPEVKPVSKPEVKPAVTAASSKPEVKPVAKPVTPAKPAAKPTATTATPKPEVKPARPTATAKPTAKPIVTTAAAKPAVKPTTSAKPEVKPAAKSEQKPAETTTDASAKKSSVFSKLFKK